MCAGRDKIMTVTPRGVDDVDVGAAVSVIDLTGDGHEDDLFLSGVLKSVKQEVVNEDSINHESDGGVQFPQQEPVNQDEEYNASP